jgi:hypothetical protein
MSPPYLFAASLTILRNSSIDNVCRHRFKIGEHVLNVHSSGRGSISSTGSGWRGALRQSPDFSIAYMLLPQVEYHNYGVFSTTTWGGSNLTYGYFRTVRTTDNVGFLYGSMRAPR